MKLSALWKKERFPYQFEAENGSFTFTREYAVDEGLFFKVFGIALRKLRVKGEMQDEYDIPEKFHGRLLKSTEYSFKKAVEEIKKDHPAFFILFKQLESAHIKKIGKKMHLTVKITGHCSGDE